MDTTINIKPQEIAPGIYSTGGTATIPTNSPAFNAIPTASLQPQNSLNIANTFPKSTDYGQSLVAGANQYAQISDQQMQSDYDRYLELSQSRESSYQSTLDNYLNQLTGASENLQGRGQAQLQAEQQTGANQLNKQLKDLNAQILSRNAEYEKLISDVEADAGRKGLTTSAVMGQQGAIARAKASEIGLLQAQALGLQGQAQEAQRQADRAVDLMYQDREAAYNTKLQQYNLIKERLTADEVKMGKAFEYALQKEKDRLDEEKQTKKDILSIGLLVSKNQAPQSVVAKINSAKTYEEAINLASPYMVSPADKLDLQLKRLQIAKASQDLRGDSNGLLSIDEAQKLGVPYGTTRAQAIALQGKTPATEIQLSTLANAQTLFTKLTEKGGMNAPVGVKNISFKIPGTPYADFTAIEKTLKNQLTLDNLKYLKGPTSDKDILFITSASTALNRNMSPKLYQKTLNDIITTLSKYSPEYQYSQAVTGLLNSVNDPYSSYTSQVLAQ